MSSVVLTTQWGVMHMYNVHVCIIEHEEVYMYKFIQCTSMQGELVVLYNTHNLVYIVLKGMLFCSEWITV